MRRFPSRPPLLSKVALVAVAAAILVGHAAVAPNGANAAGAPRFGIAAHLLWQTLTETRADLDRMRAAGMTYVRFDVSWKNSEPSRGSYRYLDKLDSVIAAIQERGMTLTMTVIETPSWANDGRGAMAPPASVDDYARFMGVLAKRYAGRAGMVYEVWNEPNDVHFWTTGPNVAKYTAMLKASYRAIKGADADATVLGGAILANDLGFLRGIYANGGRGFFDGLSIHPYVGARAPGDTSSRWFSFKRSVPLFKRVMANHGGVKPVWITEMGWSTDTVSDATRATYMKRAVAIARDWTGLRAMAAYTLHQTQFAAYGLLRPDGSRTATWQSYDSVLP